MTPAMSDTGLLRSLDAFGEPTRANQAMRQAASRIEALTADLEALEQAVLDASNGAFPPQGQADEDDAVDGLAVFVQNRRKARSSQSEEESR